VGDDHERDGEAEGVGLFLDELSTDPVHRDAVIGLAEARHELYNVETRVALGDVVQSEGTILPVQ
jgi:hypothetical protein